MKHKAVIILLVALFAGTLSGCAFTDWIARLLGNDVLIAKYMTEQARQEYMTAQEMRLQKEAEVSLQRAANEGMIYKANAQTITRQSRAHVALQGVIVLFACAGLFGTGILIAVLLDERRKHQCTPIT